MNTKLLGTAAIAIMLLLVSTTSRAAETYALDSAHSGATFRVTHLGLSRVNGSFGDISGSITLDRKNVTASSVSIAIKTASVNTNNDKRDTHLRSADFFDVEKYPEMTFVSKKVRAAGRNAYSVTGDFTLHGVTRTITVKVTKVGEGKNMQGENVIAFETTFSIKRSDYGMSGYPAIVGDKVDIDFTTEAIKQK